MRHAVIRAVLSCLCAGCFVAPSWAFDLSFKVAGASSDTRSELRAGTLLRELETEGIKDPQRILAAAQADYGRLVAALYEDGYFSPTVSIRVDGREAASVPPARLLPKVDRVRVEVSRGPRFVFGQARIAPVAPDTSLPAGFARGERARTSVVRDTTRAVINGWRDLGHARAKVAEQQITARHDAQQLDVDIAVDPGPELRFGSLVITGETEVRPERIRAIAGLRQGKVFSPLALEAAADRLQRTGTFQAVALQESDQTVNGNQMPIEAQITDRAPRRFGFGAEVSSRRGLTLSSFWLHRNIFGGAERLRVEGEIGGIGGNDGIDGRLRLRFDRPATLNARSDFYAETTLERLDEPRFRTDRFTAEAGLTWRADKTRSFSGGLGYETARTRDAFGSRSYQLLTLPLTAENDRRDDRLNPTTGWYGRAEVTPFVGLDGVGSGVRSHLDLRAYRSVGARTVFALRGQIGSLTGAEIDEAPADMLFFSGGSATVRGHSFQSLGIEQDDGDITGGRAFAGLAAEMRVKTTDSLSVVGFYDLGYIGDEPFPTGDNGSWHSGLGLGLRYDTGIGPIRFDVAGPLTGDGDGLQIYIGIGQAF